MPLPDLTNQARPQDSPLANDRFQLGEYPSVDTSVDQSEHQPEDEQQFGILFNSIDVMGTNEKAVYGVISKDNYNYFNEALRKKFDERLKCIKGDEFYGIVDFILSDFSGKEKEKVQNMLNSSK